MSGIRLDRDEMLDAVSVGGRRHVEAILRGHTRRDGTIASYDEDIEGACAELALAKYLGVEWSRSVNAFCEPDVAGFGVRWAPRHDHSLIIRRCDLERYGEDAKFVLVTGRRGGYRIAGVITLRERRPEWWRNPKNLKPAYFVPSAQLHLPHELLCAAK